jgi:hypothetical protein
VGDSTTKFTGAEFDINPLLSVARAVREYDPHAGFVHTIVYGEFVNEFKTFVP